MKRLYLDIGNSRTKWLLNDSGAETSGVLSLRGRDDADQLKKIALNVEYVAVSCVKGDEYITHLRASVRSAWGVGPQVAATLSRQQGLVCAYDEPGRLGVDRWLAMLAAWKQYEKPVCVVDCGSAITIDLVSPTGLHLGGYILPGLRLGINGLLAGTDKVIVDFDKLQAATLALGQNTTEAVYHGALFALNASVEASIKLLEERYPDYQCMLLLTGGDGGLLSQLTERESVYNEDLVLQGLKRYFDSE